ncbi:MAG: Peptide deformylase Def [Candidatus Moranbacteria bacterium GW2011_GWA2_39_41]|nr:MAG: Peptide deformylase Def [Candidatus Moranbacteria bacterium GW2011_GWA2_39_41]
MPELKIVEYPNPILSKVTEPVLDVKKPSIQKLIANMLETMEANNGVGLAAPQVGKSVRLCVIRVDDMTYILINPRVTYKSWLQETWEEGCLSFPGKFIPVKRPKKVRVKAQNELGEEIAIKAEGLLSRALQHEIDHLDGKLYIEKEVKIRKKVKK